MKWAAAGITALSILAVVFFGVQFIQVRNASHRRPIPYWEFPEPDELRANKAIRMQAIHTLMLPSGNITLTSRFNPAVDHTRRDPFPTLMYDGALYGVSAWHPQNTKQTRQQNLIDSSHLLTDIHRMYPRPSAVWEYISTEEGSRFVEAGFVLYFPVPTREVELSVITLARSWGQVSLFKWWPHRWGQHKFDHATIMQGIVPVASAVRPIKTEASLHMIDTPAAHLSLLTECHVEAAVE